ncbi:hypothetical protein AMK34_10410 [Amycolatopsis sp. CB00013]|nr:hypothetical protein AMK34_10410 [Amycolatopsis sp. CB00013]
MHFKNWVGDYEDDGDYPNLLDFITQWMKEDGFSRMDDYTSFLEAMLILIDAYERDPSILDYAGDPERGKPPRRRRVKRMLDFHDNNPGIYHLDRRHVNHAIMLHYRK